MKNKDILQKAHDTLLPHVEFSENEAEAAVLKELEGAMAGGTLVIAACESDEIELKVETVDSLKQAAQFLMATLMDAADDIGVSWASLPILDEIQDGLAAGPYQVHVGTGATPTVFTVKAQYI